MISALNLESISNHNKSRLGIAWAQHMQSRDTVLFAQGSRSDINEPYSTDFKRTCLANVWEKLHMFYEVRYVIHIAFCNLLAFLDSCNACSSIHNVLCVFCCKAGVCKISYKGGIFFANVWMGLSILLFDVKLTVKTIYITTYEYMGKNIFR